MTSVPAGISCGADCAETYAHGTAVTLTAVAGTGSTFAGWAGGGCTGAGTCVVPMTAAADVTATFTLNTYALTVSKLGTGTGTVTSSPAGITCGGDCSEVYNHGTTVVLTATPTTGTAATASVFAGWSGGGCTGTGTCSVSMTGARSVTATFDRAPNVMFVTSTTSMGALGGVTGADATCQSLAQAAGLVGGGAGQNATFRAWLSSSSVSAASQMGSASGWVRRDGRPVFNTVADIAAHRLIYPPRLDQNGNDVGEVQRVWTGTNASGTFSGSQCLAATGASPWGGTSGTGTVGLASGNSAMFTSFGTPPGCTVQARLYCMGIDRTATVTPTAQTGRFAFTSTATFSANGGLAGADAICQSEATGAGLSGSYRALLATESATAISRFNTGGAPWIRVGDRVRLTPTAAALGTPGLKVVDTVPNVNAAGTVRFGDTLLWTGAADPGTVALQGISCANWTSLANKGQGGRAGDTGVVDMWFGARVDQGTTCEQPRRVICLQL